DIKYRNTNETITQLGATIDVGRDLTLKSGRDIAVIASDITAKRDLSITATDNMLISSAADESHSYSKTKKVTRQEDHVSQVASIINAGGSITMNAGEDMTLVSSRIAAGDEAYLVAGGNLEVLAAQDSDYSLYDKKKKGSFGSSQTKRDEVTSILNIGTEISTGGKLTLLSGGDQRYQAAKLESGESLNLVSGGKITFEGVKDLHQESHEKSRNSMAWSSSKGRGTTDETLRQTELLASGGLVIDAVNGLDIDIKDVNQNTVSQTIDAMVKADPGLAWLKDAEKRGDVDWRLVKETHDSFKYSNSGMGPAAMLAVIIIVSVITAGAASTAVASVSGSLGATSATAMGSTMAAATATTAAGLGNIIASAVLTSMASTAAVSTINNKGNVGAAFHEVFSSESLKGYVLAGVTAGIAAKFGYVPTELQFDIPGVESVATKAVADALAKTAIMGGSL
ncbi:hemagglutinin repeat-containing protein, partial [Pseudomonas sp. MD195_PC81_125]